MDAAEFTIPRTHNDLDKIGKYLGLKWYDVLNMDENEYLKWHRIVILKETADVIDFLQWRQEKCSKRS